MKSDFLDTPESGFAIEVLRAGSRLASQVRAESNLTVHCKEDNSPVTVADMGIQAVAGKFIEKYFPAVALVAEENTAGLRKPDENARLEEIVRHVKRLIPEADPAAVCTWIDRGGGEAGALFWTLDPIDGTKGYLRGDQYVTALALIRKGRVEFSALGCPELLLACHEKLGKGVMLLSSRGKGCWASSLEADTPWEKLSVSRCEDIKKARILDSCDPGHKNAEKNAMIKRLLGSHHDPIGMDSQAKHATLAAGGAEIFFRTLPEHDLSCREKIWDVAPGAFAIEEAGGRVTDLNGNPIDYAAGNILKNNPGFVATNGFLHEKVVAAIRETVFPK